VLAQLAGPLAAQALHGVQGDLEAAQARQGLGAVPAETEDDAAAARAHVPGGHRGGNELGLHGGGDRLQELGQGDLPQRLLDITQADDVDRGVEPARLGDQAVDQVLHRPLVEGVDHGGPRPAAAGTDLLGNCSQLRLGTARELDQGTGGSEVARDGAADRAAGAVDHGDLVLEQHVSSRERSSRRGRAAAWTVVTRFAGMPLLHHARPA
jgi:hypothetical protein